MTNVRPLSNAERAAIRILQGQLDGIVENGHTPETRQILTASLATVADLTYRHREYDPYEFHLTSTSPASEADGEEA